MICNGREIIRAGYEAGTKVAEIARQCESTPGSVKVIAHKMGLVHPFAVHARVPAHQRYDYRVLISLGRYSAPEAAKILGLEAAGL